MGFNSTLIIMNDCLNEIKNDKNFGEKVHNAIIRYDSMNKKGIDISSGCCVNAATVIDCHHADGTSLIAIGGNYGTIISPYVYGYSHHTEKAKENILRAFANDMGFRIVRKKLK